MVDKGPGWFAVDVSAETLARTTLGGWQTGTPVNLERALRLGDELGGHLVTGHVDGVATVIERRADGDSLRFSFEVPQGFARFIARRARSPRRRLADGQRGRRRPVRRQHHSPYRRRTTFGALGPGDRVNLEIDLIARYVARLMPDK